MCDGIVCDRRRRACFVFRKIIQRKGARSPRPRRGLGRSARARGRVEHASRKTSHYSAWLGFAKERMHPKMQLISNISKVSIN